MRVKCPKCEQKFKVPDKALGTKGRKLKCSNCGHQWFQKPIPNRPKPAKAAAAPAPEEVPAEEPVAADPVDEAPDPGPEVEEPVGEEAEFGAEEAEGMDPPPLGDVSGFRGFQARAVEKPSRPVALYALIALAVLIPTVLLAARTTLVHAWPASALLYDTIGLHVPIAGEDLVLQNIHVFRRQEGTIEVLVVSGEIRNPTEGLVSLPSVQATILTETGESLESWLIVADTFQLLPGEKTAFVSEFANSDPTAARVNVTFTEDRPATGLGY